MANAFTADDSDAASVASDHSAVLIGSDESDSEIIDVESLAQPTAIAAPQVIASNSNSPVLIGDEDSSSPEEGESTDYGSEPERENEPAALDDRRLSDVIITGETAARTSVETIPDPETVVIIHPVPADGGRTSNDSGSAVRQSESHNSQEPGPSGLHRETATGVSANPAHVSEGRNTTDALHGNTARSVPLGRSLPGLDSSISQFRSPKRRKIESPEKKGDTSLEIDEEAECCSICFEQWTNSGRHRLSALKCGHLFGQSCIEKWLKGQGGKCPQCQAKASRKDIRVIYAKALRVLDTTERDRALRDLEKERAARQAAELELAQSRVRCQIAQQEARGLRDTVATQREQLNQLRANPQSSTVQETQSSSSSQSVPSTQSNDGYAFDRVIKVHEGGCRVMAFSSVLGYLVASQPSSSPLFPGYGVKKLSCVDFRASQYVALHSHVIRDVAFNNAAADGLLLSCSMDKSVKLTSLASNTAVLSYQCDVPVWACAWDADDGHYFYTGLTNGAVSVFDTRNTAEAVRLLRGASRSPVVSLQYVRRSPHAHFRPGGLLVGQLDHMMFYEKKSGDFRPHILPANGNLASLSLEETTRHILASYRPGGKYATIRHQLSALRGDGPPDNTVVTSEAVQTFTAGRAMTQLRRSCLVPHPTEQGALMVCAPDETTCTLQIFDCSSGVLKKNIPTHQPVVDVCHVTVQGEHYLAALTDKVIRLHKWRHQ